MDEIVQHTSASLVSQLEEPGLKRKINDENKFTSKIKRRKWDDDYSMCGRFLRRSVESSHEPSAC